MSRRQPPDKSLNDGRVRRGARNRDRIVDAVIALVRRGTPRPSADEIAAMAGTGTRTVFRQFSDMEALFAAVRARVHAEILPLVDASPIEGTLCDRAREVVRRRVRVFERLRPFRLSGMPHQHTSAVIRRGHRALDVWTRGHATSIVGGDGPAEAWREYREPCAPPPPATFALSRSSPPRG